MSFMAVAYIPAYLEDLSLFKKERANGLYGPIAFMVSNFITGLPFLCKFFRHYFAASVLRQQYQS